MQADESYALDCDITKFKNLVRAESNLANRLFYYALLTEEQFKTETQRLDTTAYTYGIYTLNGNKDHSKYLQKMTNLGISVDTKTQQSLFTQTLSSEGVQAFMAACSQNNIGFQAAVAETTSYGNLIKYGFIPPDRGREYFIRISKSSNVKNDSVTNWKVGPYTHETSSAGFQNAIFEREDCHKEGYITFQVSVEKRWWQKILPSDYKDYPAGSTSITLPPLVICEPTSEVAIRVTRLPHFAGGRTGVGFDDSNLNPVGKLTGIDIKGHAIVDSIVSYWGAQKGTRRGGSGGSVKERIRFYDNERVTAVILTYGSYIDGIQFTTNLRTHRIGWVGPGWKNPRQEKTIDIPDGYELVGFWGGAGKYVDHIGLVVRNTASRSPDLICNVSCSDDGS